MCAHRLRPLYNVNRACSLHLCVTAAWRPFSHRRCSDCCIDWWDKVVCSRDPVGTDSRVGQRGEDGLCIDGPRNSAKRLVARLQLSVGRVRVGTQAVALHRSKGWVVAEVRIASECSEPQRARSCMLVHSASAGSRTRSPADSIAAPPFARTRTRTCIRTRVSVFAYAFIQPRSFHTTTKAAIASSCTSPMESKACRE